MGAALNPANFASYHPAKNLCVSPYQEQHAVERIGAPDSAAVDGSSRTVVGGT